MIRKMILTAALAVTAGIAAMPSTAQAQPRPRPGYSYGRFAVLVRHRGHWDNHGVYRDRDDARRIARQLRMRGYDVKIERI